MRTTLVTITIYSQEETERFAADELLVIWAEQSIIAEKIATEGYNIPEDLQRSLKMLKRQLDFKLEADLERELANIDSRLEATKTAEEKRAGLTTRREEILAKLARKTAASA